MGGWGHSFPNKNHKFWTNENSPFVFPNLTKTLGWVSSKIWESFSIKKRFYINDSPYQFMQEDGIAAEFRLIYREASSFQSHKVFQVDFIICWPESNNKSTQVAGMVIPLFPYYFAYKTWPDHLFFKYYIGQTLLALWMSALTFYNLRMFYRVPHRCDQDCDTISVKNQLKNVWMFYIPMWCIISGLTRLYYSSTSSIYKVVLNQVLPWQKKLVVPFRPSEIAQVDTDKSGWKVGDINTEFFLMNFSFLSRWLELRNLSWFQCNELFGWTKIPFTSPKTTGLSVGRK